MSDQRSNTPSASTGFGRWSPTRFLTGRRPTPPRSRPDRAALAGALAATEREAVALATALGEEEEAVGAHGPALSELARATAHLAADALAVLDVSWPAPVGAASAVTAVDLCHLLRERLRRHSDRLADLANAELRPSPGAIGEVADMERLVERLIGQIVPAPPVQIQMINPSPDNSGNQAWCTDLYT